MIQRCYSKKELEKAPQYSDVEVCAEWIYFSNFKAWMETQDWEGKELDKDLLFEGNKIYSPETCCFIPQRLNVFLAANRINRGSLFLGVDKIERSKPFRSQGKTKDNKRLHLGVYNTELEAHLMYLKHKLGRLLEFIEEIDDPLILKGLNRVKLKIESHLEKKIPLFSF